MKTDEALKKAQTELELAGVENCKLDALILLTHILSCSKEQIIFNPDFVLNKKQQSDFFDLVNRRVNREPVSHLIEKREFFSRDFFVNSSVLDPRPDSENLVEAIIEKFPAQQKLNFLELGVGSGCLIISLLCHYKNSCGLAVDISDLALSVAKKNSEKYLEKNRLEFLKSDLFDKISPAKNFDIIISNPPYIPSLEIDNLQMEVKKYEPRIALDGGDDGLDFYRRIANKAADFLQKNGAIFLEIGFGQKVEIEKIFAEKNFSLCAVKKDLSGIERILEFIYKC